MLTARSNDPANTRNSDTCGLGRLPLTVSNDAAPSKWRRLASAVRGASGDPTSYAGVTANTARTGGVRLQLVLPPCSHERAGRWNWVVQKVCSLKGRQNRRGRMTKVKIGVHLPVAGAGASPQAVTDVAVEAERVGLGSVWSWGGCSARRCRLRWAGPAGR